QRGIDAPAWYWLDAHGQYQNWTGTGNTLNVAQRDVARWVMDCLRHWRQSFHIDGFRFDLASVLGREPEFHTGAHFF
ncbi:multicopper oxidase domain-containing protein, partial [Guyparkeria sp. 1SP6A2]|nr:multicopper oxidase domain-containing protein [Guyparkeria sp. 1SP6A2]